MTGRNKARQSSPERDTFKIGIDTLLNSLQNFEDKPDQNISYFFEEFEELAAAAQFPEDLKLVLAKSKFKGQAREILKNTAELHKAQNYNTFKENAITQFKKERSFADAQAQFINAKQTPNQTIEEFTKQFNIEAQKYLVSSGHEQKNGAKELLETIKLTKYLEALRPDISFELKKYPPTKFDEAVKKAKNIESALNSKCAGEINNLTENSENKLFEALLSMSQEQKSEIHQLKEQIKDLKIQKNESEHNNAEVNQITHNFCHICNKSNHQTQNCYFNQKSANFFQPRGAQNNVRPRFQKNYYQNHNYRGFQRFPQNYAQHFQAPQTLNFARPYYNQTRFNDMQIQMPNWQNLTQSQIGPNQMYHGNYNMQNMVPMQNFDPTQGNNTQIAYTGQHQSFANMQNSQNPLPQNNEGNRDHQPTITFPNENRDRRGRHNNNNRNRGQSHLNR